MKYIPKIACAVSLCLAFLSCGEELFDTAKRYADGINFTVALVEDGSKASVLVTGSDYYRKYEVYEGTPAFGDQVYMDDRGTIYATQGMTIYASTGGSGWVTYTIGALTPQGFASEDGSALTLVNNYIYEFDSKSDPPWREEKDLSPGSYSWIFRASDGNGIYLADSGGGFYSLENPGSMIQDVAGLSAIFFYDRVDGVFYAGDSTAFGSGSGDSYNISSGTAHGYAAISATSIYAVGFFSTNLAIMRGVPGSPGQFVLDYGFSSSVGQMKVGVVDAGTLAVGVRGSGTEDGLYLYSTSSKSLQKITSLPVVALYTRR